MSKHHFKPNLRASARSDARNPTRSRLANENFARDYFANYTTDEEYDAIAETVRAIAARRPGGSIYG